MKYCSDCEGRAPQQLNAAIPVYGPCSLYFIPRYIVVLRQSSVIITEQSMEVTHSVEFLLMQNYQQEICRLGYLNWHWKHA